MAGRPKKTVEDTMVVDDINTDTVDVEKEELKEQNLQMADMMKSLQKQVSDLAQELKNTKAMASPNVIKTVRSSGKKIKCINLMHNPVNISTEPDGNGIVKTFDNYGDSKTIKFDDLSDMLSAYPYTMTHGLIYICDKDVVEELGLTDEYESIYSKEKINEIMELNDESSVELLVGMEKNIRDSTIHEIAIRMKDGYHYDMNRIYAIKKKLNIDIEDLSRQISEEENKKVVEE